jgi:dTDP-glucose 4,6-dehydratase
MTVLVTGGAGFIGSALVRRLVAEGETVVTVDKLTYAGNRANLAPVANAPNHRFVKADICDVRAMTQVFAEARPTQIFHLAAESHVDRSIDSALPFVRTNVLGTSVLLGLAADLHAGLDKAARNTFRFVHVSTDEVFGELGETGKFDEETAYKPNSPYAATKAGADHLARAWCRTFGLPVIVTNCSNNYGPYQHPEKLIPNTVLSALAGRPIPVYGTGENVRDWLWVDDHVAGLVAAARDGRPGATYLIGGHGEARNIDVVRTICRHLDALVPAAAPHERLITFVTDRPGHDARYAIDPQRITDELGWAPKVDLDEGLARTVAWYAENKVWCRQALARSPIGRLGLGRAR